MIYNTLLAAGYEGMNIPAIWSKGNGQTMRTDLYLGRSFEPFFYLRKGGASIVRQGRIDVFNWSAVHHEAKIHPTQRPIELMVDVLSTFADEGARVCVPCAGSGTTLRAAAMLDMEPIGYDIVPEFRTNFISSLM